MKKIFFAGLLLMMFTPSTLASYPYQEIPVWTNLGLYGGQILDIAIDPKNPDKMFAGSYLGDGLFVTIDGGNEWQAVETENLLEGEDTFKNHSVAAVRIAPSNHDVVWVAHNYWVERSMDGGKNWNHIRLNGMQRDCTNCGGETDKYRFCKSLAIDPEDSQTIFVGTGGPNGSYSGGAIYVTRDGGGSWTKVWQGRNFNYTVTDIAFDPQNSQIVWAVTSSLGVGGWGGGLYRSGDKGDSWTRVFNTNAGFASVAVKPNDSNIVFTGSGYGIIKHFFDGTSWLYKWPVVPENVGCRDARDIIFDPKQPEVLYVTWKNPWAGDKLPKISRSLNGGVDWETYVVDYFFSTLAIHPTNGEVIFGGDFNYGVFRSGDHGRTWSPMNNGINAVFVYDVGIDPQDKNSARMIAGTISGVYELKRQGEDWSSSRLLSYDTRSVEFDPNNSQRFYAGLASGYVRKTTDGGQNWESSNYLGGEVNDICVIPMDTETIYAATAAGSICKSVNGGISFSPVHTGKNKLGQTYPFNVVKVDPSNGSHVFAGGGNFYAPKVDGDLWESTDSGVTWKRNSLSDLNVIVNSILIDPDNPKLIYAGCGHSGGTDIPVYKSTDGGATWGPSHDGIPGMVITLQAVWGSSATDVFAVANYGPFFPTTPILRYNGSSWIEMDSGVKEALYGIWGASGTNLFAVGASGTILQFDGKSWSAVDKVTNESLYGVHGSSPANIFAVGNNGTILRYDGKNWLKMESGTSANLYGIWTTYPQSAFAVGAKGTILYYDGSSWVKMDSGTPEELRYVWGISTTKVYAVGTGGTILHYDGTTWTSMPSGTTRYLNQITGISDREIYVTGSNATVLRFDGQAWLIAAEFGTKEPLRAIWADSGADIFVVGGYGSVRRYDGNTWNLVREPGANWNAVTDLEFHRRDTTAVYASTLLAGIYVSPNQGRNWLNLEKPDYKVLAISSGSLYAGTQAGLWQCTGTGVIAGRLTDAFFNTSLDKATVFSDMGLKTISVDGEYMMVAPAGVCSVTAVRDGYANKTKVGITVLGGDVTWVSMPMEVGVSDPTVIEMTAGGQIGGGG
jgi:photosystem II stability/assembly factor-like uncharacterized protein